MGPAPAGEEGVQPAAYLLRQPSRVVDLAASTPGNPDGHAPGPAIHPHLHDRLRLAQLGASGILTFITLRLGFHASATLIAAVGSSNRPSPNSPSRSSCAPTGPSATQGKDRARTGRSESLTAQRTRPRTAA